MNVSGALGSATGTSSRGGPSANVGTASSCRMARTEILIDKLRVCTLHEFLRSAAHLVGCNILNVCCQCPLVSKWILQRPRPIPVELILERLKLFCSACDRLLENFVHLIDVYHQPHAGSAERLRATMAHFGMLIREHDDRIANLDLGVPYPPIRARHAHQLNGAECPLVEIDCVGAPFDNEIGGDRVVTVGNWLGGHNLLLSDAVELTSPSNSKTHHGQCKLAADSCASRFQGNGGKNA